MTTKGWLFLGTGILVLLVGTWLLSANITRRGCVAEFAQAPRETTYVAILDTVWREVVRIKTLTSVSHDTVYVAKTPTYPAETLYVIGADTSNERFSLHLEYAQPEPLAPEGFFQNVRVDIRDSVRTVEVTVHHTETVTEWPMWQMIAISTATLGLGVWIGSR